MGKNVGLLRVLFMAMIITARRCSRNCVIIVLKLLSLLQWHCLPIHAYKLVKLFFLNCWSLMGVSVYTRTVWVLVSGRTACEASQCSRSDQRMLTEFLTVAHKFSSVCVYRKTLLWTTWVGDGGSRFLRNYTASPPIKPQCLQRRENQRYHQ